MSRFLLLCIVCLCVTGSVFATWEYVGPPAFGPESNVIQSNVVTKGNRLYIGITESGEGYPWVYTWDGFNRSSLGPSELEPNMALGTKLFNYDDQLYMGYESNEGSRLAVMKHLGSGSWEFVGEKGVSFGPISGPDFDVDESGNIYAAFRDGELANFVSVMKWNGIEWVYLGGAAASEGPASSATIAVASEQEVYVAYRDNTGEGGGRLTVRKRNGEYWSEVGPIGLGEGNNSIYPSLVYTPLGQLFLAYSDGSQSQMLTVVQWNGGGWDYVGGVPGISHGEARYIDMKADALGNVYILYSDISQAKEATVQKRDGELWSFVGNPDGFSEGSATHNSLSISKYNKLFVSYTDSVTTQLAMQSWEEPYTCFSATGDACIIDVGAGEVKVLTIRSPLESLALYFELGWQNNMSTLFSGSYASLGQSGYFVVEDSAGDDAGYYTTVQASDLTGLSGSVIPASLISMSASDNDIAVLAGLSNSNVHVNISSGAFLDNAQTLLYRASGYNNNIVGTYGVAPNLYIDIPPYQELDIYSGTITYTLYYNY